MTTIVHLVLRLAIFMDEFKFFFFFFLNLTCDSLNSIIDHSNFI